MSDLAARLNEILSEEWACVRALRRAEARCDDPGRHAVLQCVRRDAGRSCVTLAHAVRAAGGRPTDVPSPRFSLQLTEETTAEIVGIAETAQRYIVAAIDRLIDDPDARAVRASLQAVRRQHEENIRWLITALRQ